MRREEVSKRATHAVGSIVDGELENFGLDRKALGNSSIVLLVPPNEGLEIADHEKECSDVSGRGQAEEDETSRTRSGTKTQQQ